MREMCIFRRNLEADLFGEPQSMHTVLTQIISVVCMRPCQTRLASVPGMGLRACLATQHFRLAAIPAIFARLLTYD